jgi:hypothetical protein
LLLSLGHKHSRVHAIEHAHIKISELAGGEKMAKTISDTPKRKVIEVKPSKKHIRVITKPKKKWWE